MENDFIDRSEIMYKVLKKNDLAQGFLINTCAKTFDMKG